MLPIPNYQNYFIDETEVLPRIWSKRRAGCRGVFIDVINNSKYRCCHLANNRKKVEFKIISHLVWSAHNPTKNVNHKIIGYTDGNQANDRYDNLYAKERWIRDSSGNVVISFN